jgi:hypothetical protein
MTLAELQSKLQAGTLEDDRAILASVADSPKTDRATLFTVYYDAYRMRLAEFLSQDYPMFRDRLGDEAFGGLVEDYILSAPSRHRNACWYGACLLEFMGEMARWRENREAINLARFERALSDAFDAADAPQVSIDALANVPPEGWPRIAFEFHPSFMLLDLACGTAGRNDNESFYRHVAQDERLALIEARRGEKFSDICALLDFQGGNEDVALRVAGFLSQWLVDGLVARLVLMD